MRNWKTNATLKIMKQNIMNGGGEKKKENHDLNIERDIVWRYWWSKCFDKWDYYMRSVLGNQSTT